MTGAIEYKWEKEEDEWYLHLGLDRVARVAKSLPGHSHHPRWMILKLSGLSDQVNYQELPVFGYIFDENGQIDPAIKPSASLCEVKKMVLDYYGIKRG